MRRETLAEKAMRLHGIPRGGKLDQVFVYSCSEPGRLVPICNQGMVPHTTLVVSYPDGSACWASGDSWAPGRCD